MLKRVELAQPTSCTSEYVMGVDLATSSERTADNAVICVLKLIELESGAYLKKLVYMRSYHGKRLDALADEVRKTYAAFPARDAHRIRPSRPGRRLSAVSRAAVDR